MLVLSRKPGQSLLIGDDIKLHVIKIHEGRVSIGIEAPREINVRRSEIAKLPVENEGSSDVDQRTTTNS